MSSKIRSSLVLVAFVAGIGVTYSARSQGMTPRPVLSQHTMRDSADTALCDGGWIIIGGFVQCTNPG